MTRSHTHTKCTSGACAYAQINGELERAEVLLHSALSLDPNNVKVHIARAQLEMRKGNTAQARAILATASGT